MYLPVYSKHEINLASSPHAKSISILLTIRVISRLVCDLRARGLTLFIETVRYFKTTFHC